MANERDDLTPRPDGTPQPIDSAKDAVRRWAHGTEGYFSLVRVAGSLGQEILSRGLRAVRAIGSYHPSSGVVGSGFRVGKWAVARRVENDFVNEQYEVSHLRVNSFATVLTLLIGVSLIAFLIWASRAELEEVTRGDGKVIPSSRNQIIQNLEGGILFELLVSEGNVVERNQILLKIANTVAESELRDIQSQAITIQAQITRLEAEAFGKPFADVERNAPDVARNERQLYETRLAQLEAQLAVLRDQLNQRRQELVELRARQQSVSKSLDLARSERDILAPLIPQGAASKVDLIRVERQVADLEGQLTAVRLSIPRVEGAVLEAQKRLDERVATFRSEANTELNKNRALLATLTERIVAGGDRVVRTDVRSPVRGIIKEIKVNTIGGVVRPGQDLIEVVPLEDTLLIEANVKPADIAFIRPGQPAMIKVTAYDFSIYGGLRGKLEQISADTIKEEKERGVESYYRVRLRTDKNYLGSENIKLPIIPGMTVQAEILTGRKTVLDYLLKPVLKVRDRALRER